MKSPRRRRNRVIDDSWPHLLRSGCVVVVFFVLGLLLIAVIA